MATQTLQPEEVRNDPIQAIQYDAHAGTGPGEMPAAIGAGFGALMAFAGPRRIRFAGPPRVVYTGHGPRACASRSPSR